MRYTKYHRSVKYLNNGNINFEWNANSSLSKTDLSEINAVEDVFYAFLFLESSGYMYVQPDTK